MDGSDVLLHQAEFEARRRRVLARLGGLLLIFALGLALLIAARQSGPVAEEAAAAVFSLTLIATGLWLWRTLRRVWRCPACDVRWVLGDALASLHWNHCAHCGTALRATAVRSTREREQLDAFDPSELADAGARLQRRGRIGLAVATCLAVVGLAVAAWAHGAGWSPLLQHAAIALVVGIGTVAAFVTSRCPRCSAATLGARGGHCQRCGLVLRGRPAAGTPPDGGR